MTEERARRKLSGILSADAVGFIEKWLKFKLALLVRIKDFEMIRRLAPNLQVGFVEAEF